jgi:adenylate cyclase
LVLLDATYATVGILVMYTSMTYAGYSREEASRRQTRDAFSKYLSPDMVERVAGDPGALKLGGDQRDMTLLFCDVRGFTTISEQFDAVGLTALINKLLTPLTNVILERRGTIDKYMGDCIMAFWNAPLDDDDQEYNGCASALAMLAEMEPLNARLEQEAIEEGRKHIPLKVGLGLNTGPCVVGNMGSDMRFDYSVLGDAVNLAARLEGQSKSYGMNVVLGPNTRNAVKERLATIDLDFIQVKGKTTGTMIYGLMGDEEVLADPKFQYLQKLIFDAMEMYRAQQWDQAQEMFDEIRELGSDENKPWKLEANLHILCDLYDERITLYREAPPPADWDGVFIATSK